MYSFIIEWETHYYNLGGSLYFAGLLKDPSTHGEKFEFDHVPGRALLHIGKVCILINLRERH